MSHVRIKRLQKKLHSANLDGAVITHLDHVRYLIGFTGSSGYLVIAGSRAEFLTDTRYTFQAAKQVKGAKVKILQARDFRPLSTMPFLSPRNIRIGYSGSYLTVARKLDLKQSLPHALLVSIDDILNDLGWVKDKEELASIKKAVAVSDTAFERIVQLVRPGVRERELAAELEYQMAMLGSEKPAFESIVASGYRSAMPHGIASQKKLQKGDLVTFDFGATINGYVSDITRTVVVGKATARQKKIYNLVLRAQKAGIAKIRAGVAGKLVDATCRNIISRAGYGSKFGHGTGHGIGFYVHTGPSLSPISGDKLKAGNVVTVEPGIYIEGWGGVRIEDDVLVTRNGGKVLNKAEKKLLEL